MDIWINCIYYYYWLIGFLLYKQQMLKNIEQKKDNELKLALEKIESQTSYRNNDYQYQGIYMII